MSNETKITATYAAVPFEDTYISDLNPRKIVAETGIKALAENIRQCGLIHPLAGMTDAKGKTAIVAGGRRHRALALLQDDPRFRTVPVNIAPNAATAQAWASAENANREALHPADEIRDYGDMAARGIPVPSIAVAYGVTEPHVYRRLKLAHLPAPVLDALRAGQITLQNAAAFTLCDDEKTALVVLEKVRGHGYSDHHIRQMLKPDAVRDTDRRAVFVGIETYEARGGRTTRDLFEQTTYLDDPALLDEIFAAKLTAAADLLRGKGWKWAAVSPTPYIGYHEIEDRKLDRIYPQPGSLTEIEAARYDELAELAEAEVLGDEGAAELAALQETLDGAFTPEQKALSGVIVYVDREGRLQGCGGLVTREDRAAAIRAGVLRPSQHAPDTAPKSPISAKLRDDLERIAKGARQNAILAKPDLLLDLLAFQLSHGLAWNAPLGIRTEEVPNWPSTEADGYALDTRLTENPPRDAWDKDMAKSFRAFRAKGRDHMRAELTRYLAAHYKGGAETLAALVDKESKPDIRAVWTPTAENFFARVSASYLTDLWLDLLDLPEDHPTATTFAKLKKGEKAAKLETLFACEDARKAHRVTEAQAAKIAAWLPEGMA
ncbi:MAG: ParB/RepB/Spo0J family partition protein [Roseovarius sp.]